MVATTALKFWLQGQLQFYDLPTEFHKNLPVCSEVGGRGQTRHTDRMVISLAYNFPLGRKAV
jgi:hypothetical protein